MMKGEKQRGKANKGRIVEYQPGQEPVQKDQGEEILSVLTTTKPFIKLVSISVIAIG